MFNSQVSASVRILAEGGVRCVKRTVEFQLDCEHECIKKPRYAGCV